MSTPLYFKVFESIKQQILDGTFSLGDKLPSDLELTEKYKVSKITIGKAMNLLKEEKLIKRIPKKGTFVSKEIKMKSDNRQRKIGVLLSYFNDLFGSTVLQELVKQTTETSQIILKISDSDSKLEEKCVSYLINEKVDALILLPTSSITIPPSILTLVAKQFPLVVFDRELSDIPVCTVSTDNRKAGNELTEELLQSGHQQITMIADRTSLSSVSDRVQGFIDAHMKHSIPINKSNILHVRRHGTNELDDIEFMTNQIFEFLKKNTKSTGFVVEEYALAYCLQRALHRLGLKVPEDKSIVCFDYPPFEDLVGNRIITHYKQDETAIAKKCLDLILFKEKNPDKYKKSLVTGSIVHGNSVKSLK